MTTTDDANECTPSTTWRWINRTIRVPAGGQQALSAKRRRFFGRSPRNPREPLTIKIKYRGGSECWYEVHARGCEARYPGATALHDMMAEINCVGFSTGRLT